MKLDYKEIIQYAWVQAQKHFSKSLYIWLIVIVLELISKFSKKLPLLLQFPVTILILIVWMFLSFTLLKILLRITNGESFEPKDIFAWNSEQLGPYMVVAFMRQLIVFFGFLLLIVPGFVWSYKYMYATYIVVDKKLPWKESLRESARITDGYKWKLVGLSFVYLGLFIAGVLVFFVGTLFTFPVTLIAHAYVYRKLSSATPQLAAAAP